MTETEMRKWIDESSYESLLRKWRFAPTGDPIFAGEIGDYYGRVLQLKRKELGEANHILISKRIGWGTLR